ncbi:MAG: SpoIVB peptidase [Clostridia bacterium]|nr:SpoIVB peptidase [Clostridia bacterium]
MKKKILISAIISILLIALIYVSDITNIPDSIILFEEEELNINTIFGMSIKTLEVSTKDIDTTQNGEIIQASSGSYANQEESINVGINLFGIKVKEVSVNVIDDVEVVPLGGLIGMKLYTNGVLVVGMSEIYGENNQVYKPYENSGIKEGDTITKINGENIVSTDDMTECINASKGKEINITYIHNNKTLETKITPVETDKNNYKVGLWVRDTAAGVGTATFYDKNTGNVAMLGHGILDVDTEELIDISDGKVTNTSVVSIIKGENGKTGRIQGIVEGEKEIGTISKNTYYGVYGKLYNVNELKRNTSNSVKIALRNEIKTGEATLMCALDNGEVKEYTVEIQKIYLNNNSNNKSMLLKVTDKELLEKTGGIIQGMSGSPILQDGKLIGALTHVLVQNPTQGYAVFSDIMVKQMNDIK